MAFVRSRPSIGYQSGKPCSRAMPRALISRGTPSVPMTRIPEVFFASCVVHAASRVVPYKLALKIESAIGAL